MKKVISFIVIFFFSIPLYSQTVDCDSCPETEWNSMNNVSVSGKEPSEIYTLTLDTNSCDDNSYGEGCKLFNIKIKGISINNSNKNNSVKDVLKQTLISLITSNPRYLPPVNSSDTNCYIWRFHFNVSCFSYSSLDASQVLQCESGNPCCYTFKIRWISNCSMNIPSWQFISRNSIPVKCPENNSIQLEQCEFICNEKWFTD